MTNNHRNRCFCRIHSVSRVLNRKLFNTNKIVGTFGPRTLFSCITKYDACVLSETIACLMNNSLRAHVIPACWEIPTIGPLPKSKLAFTFSKRFGLAARIVNFMKPVESLRVKIPPNWWQRILGNYKLYPRPIRRREN